MTVVPFKTENISKTEYYMPDYLRMNNIEAIRQTDLLES